MDADACSNIGIVGVHLQVRGQLPNIGQIPLDVQATGPVEVIPLRQIVALPVEHLHAMALPVGHIHAAPLVGAGAVHQVELAGIRAVGSPGKDMLPLKRVLVHAGIAIAIGDIEIARLGIEGHLGGLVKGLAAVPSGRLTGHADGHQQFAVQAELIDTMGSIVRTVKGIIRTRCEAVGSGERALAPGGHKTAVGLKDHHGMIPPVKDVDAILAIHGHVGHLFEGPAFGQLGPLHVLLVNEPPTAKFGHHKRLLPIYRPQ